jgi:hypothetical protein
MPVYKVLEDVTVNGAFFQGGSEVNMTEEEAALAGDKLQLVGSEVKEPLGDSENGEANASEENVGNSTSEEEQV